MTARRSAEWSALLGGAAPIPTVMNRSASGEWAEFMSAFASLMAPDNVDTMVRRAVEIGRSRIGLERVGIYLVDPAAAQLNGTWGTDLNGHTVDEHHVMFSFNDGVVDVFRRAEQQGEPFTVFENCPIVEHKGQSSQVVGRGWIACTPIRSPASRIGMMFNDVGLGGAAVDHARQARAAILCSLLGSLIELSRSRPGPERLSPRSRVTHPLIFEAIEMLSNDPRLAGKEIASALGVSLSWLVRLFKVEVGVSLVDYRNRLRIDRFLSLVDSGENNLQSVSRAAGFGSYAQFHRVFRVLYGTAPSNFLRARLLLPA